MQLVINLMLSKHFRYVIRVFFSCIDRHIKILHSKISRLLLYTSYRYLITAEARKAEQIA